MTQFIVWEGLTYGKYSKAHVINQVVGDDTTFCGIYVPQYKNPIPAPHHAVKCENCEKMSREKPRHLRVA